MKRITLVIFALLICSCAKQPPAPVGISEWNDVYAAAINMALNADPTAFLLSLDRSGVPESRWSEPESLILHWKKSKLRSHYVETLDLTLSEHENFLEEKRKLADPDSTPIKASNWNIAPARVLVFRFERKKEKSEFSTSITIGAFQRNGLWYFCFSR
jgi:hypothetical protein